MNTLSRGNYWFSLLTHKLSVREEIIPSVKVADGEISGYPIRYIAVVSDADNHYPRARSGEVGLLEGWVLAKVIHECILADKDNANKRAIIAVIDVPSQAYGRREEGFGIHQALAGAVSAYAQARLAAHPVIGLIVGKAMSGAFLAHGYQANQLIAFDDPQVMVHAMGKASAARITLRSVEALEHLAAKIPPMAYDIKNYQTLGLLDQLLTLENPDNATQADQACVKNALITALHQARQHTPDLSHRLQGENRKSSLLVRERMRQEWLRMK